MVKIDQLEKEVIVHFSRSTIDQKILTKVLDMIAWENAVQESRLTEANADKLAKEINHKVWQRLKPQVLGNKDETG